MSDGRRWKLYTAFKYCVSSLEKPTAVIEVPLGFVTDFASIPRALWIVFPPTGRYCAATVVHDYMYATARGTRKWADAVFYEAMGVLGVPHLQRRLMWLAVRAFGRGAYAERWA